MPAPALETPRQVLEHSQVPWPHLAAGFERAARLGVHEFRFLVAGFPVQIRVAGAVWAEIIAASMGHLQNPAHDDEPALRIDVWDAEETQIAAPIADRDRLATPILMRTSEDGAHIGEDRAHSMLWFDRPNDHIVGFTQSARQLNLDERARPFHKMLSAWLEERGIQFVHSGLITHADKGILFVGNGGRGKSTSSISCLRAGMGYLGDDFIGLGEDQGRFVGHGLYASCLLNVHHIQRFPQLLPLAQAPYHSHEDKYVLYLSEAFPGCLRQRSRIDAIVLPKVHDAKETTFKRASKAAALMAIAPTSVMYLSRPNRAAFERLTRLVETTPCYWLELGREVDRIPDAVRELAQGL